jgi:hypothetical protein
MGQGQRVIFDEVESFTQAKPGLKCALFWDWGAHDVACIVGQFREVLREQVIIFIDDR